MSGAVTHGYPRLTRITMVGVPANRAGPSPPSGPGKPAAPRNMLVRRPVGPNEPGGVWVCAFRLRPVPGNADAVPTRPSRKCENLVRLGHAPTETLKGGKVSPEARVLGFVILMVAIFLGAYKAGAFLGPVIPAHSVVGTPGGGQAPSMNMNMGAGPARPTARAGTPVTGIRR